MRRNKIAVVILMFHSEVYLPDLFAGLEKTLCERQWGIVIVDNGSSDGTVTWLEQYCATGSLRDRVTVIRNTENTGFAGGNNVGMQRALDDGADAVVLLNPDTVVDASWLSALIAASESDPAIGAVQSRLMLANDRERINSIGNAIHFLGFGYSVGNGEELGMRNLELGMSDITYASGAAVLYKRETLKDVGLLDDWLFMYHEDLEMGWRLWRAGWRSVLAPASVVYHKYEFSRSIKKYYLMERNRFAVMAMHYSIPTLILIAPALCLMEIGLFFFAVRSGWWREKARVYTSFLSPATWRHIFESRARLRSITRVRERDVVRRFVGTIGYQEIDNAVLRYIANPFFAAYWFVIRRLIVW